MRHPNSNVYDFGVSANLISKYLNESTAIHVTLENLLGKIDQNSYWTNVIGVLLHHRFHYNELSLIDNFLKELKMKNYLYSTIEELIGYKNKSGR